MTDLYQTIIEIFEDRADEDARVLGRYSFSTFANSEAEAHAKVVAEWESNGLHAPGTGFMVSVEHKIENGSLEGAIVPRPPFVVASRE
jgi:hypothetical protein